MTLASTEKHGVLLCNSIETPTSMQYSYIKAMSSESVFRVFNQMFTVCSEQFSALQCNYRRSVDPNDTEHGVLLWNSIESPTSMQYSYVTVMCSESVFRVIHEMRTVCAEQFSAFQCNCQRCWEPMTPKTRRVPVFQCDTRGLHTL
jgi:hypothetical protein